jgi:hypothetical protein
MDASTYAALQGAFVRMVVPMRREFGVTLDVPRMRTDIEYAQSAVALALHSDSPALHHCAELVDHFIRAARAARSDDAPPDAAAAH